MTDTIDDLIQRALEGEATAAERARLEARLASDPAARGRYDDLSRVFETLAATSLAEPPAGMRDEVLRAIRGAAPAWAPASARAGRPASAARAPALAGRPAFSWLRIALPVAAGAVAVLVMFAAPLTRWIAPGDNVTGTMSGLRSTDGLRLGTGPGAVLVQWGPSAAGFELRIRTGNESARVVLEALTPETTLSLAPGAPTPSPRIEATLPANALVIAEGAAPSTRATVRVSVTFPDGRLATGEVGLRGLRPSR